MTYQATFNVPTKSLKQLRMQNLIHFCYQEAIGTFTEGQISAFDADGVVVARPLGARSVGIWNGTFVGIYVIICLIE